MALTIVETPITGGVDTHADVHVAAALDPVGGLLGVAEFPVSPAGYARLLSWLGGFGTVCLVGIEGTGSLRRGPGPAHHRAGPGGPSGPPRRPGRRPWAPQARTCSCRMPRSVPSDRFNPRNARREPSWRPSSPVPRLRDRCSKPFCLRHRSENDARLAAGLRARPPRRRPRSRGLHVHDRPPDRGPRARSDHRDHRARPAASLGRPWHQRADPRQSRRHNRAPRRGLTLPGDDRGDFTGHGIGKLLVPLIVRRQAASEMPENMRRLKQRLESGS